MALVEDLVEISSHRRIARPLQQQTYMAPGGEKRRDHHLTATPFQGCGLLLAVLHAVYDYHGGDPSSRQVREVVQKSVAEGQVVAPGGGYRAILWWSSIFETISILKRKKKKRYDIMRYRSWGRARHCASHPVMKGERKSCSKHDIDKRNNMNDVI